MMKVKLIGLMIVLFISMGTVNVNAATIYSAICFDAEVDFDDRVYGDRYTDTSDKNAYGVYAKIYKEMGGMLLTVYEDFASAEAGCLIAELDTTETYRIKLYSKAYLDDDIEIHIYNNDDDFQYHSQVVVTGWTPNILSVFTYEYNTLWKVSNVLAAVGKSINNKPAGVSDHSIDYFTQACPSGNWSCRRDNGIYINSGGRESKFTIAHETGHELSEEQTGTNVSNCNPSAPYPCNSSNHSYQSKEWQTCAAWEGFADFYAAAVWNYKNEDSCDYKDEECAGSARRLERVCGSPYSMRGVEGDWVRFWWDMFILILFKHINTFIPNVSFGLNEDD